MNAPSRFKPVTYETPQAKPDWKFLPKRMVGFLVSLLLFLILEFIIMKLVFAHA
jgi:hypothetical protein